MHNISEDIRKIRFDIESPTYLRKLLECETEGYVFVASGRRSRLMKVLKRMDKLREFDFTVFIKDCTLSIENKELLFDTIDINSYTSNSFFRLLLAYPKIKVDNC